jgi:uncharacterized membrane protein YgcG
MARTLSDRVAFHCFQPLRAWKRPLWTVALLVSMSAWGQGLQAIPSYAPVVDRVGVLTPAEHSALTHKLLTFEHTHGSELGVVLVPTTKPEPIEDFANRLANNWKLGRQGIGDGVVIVIAVSDKTSRIEVSKVLEGAIPDLEAKRILQREITPSLRDGAYFQGISSGLDSLFAAIEHENLPHPHQSPSTIEEFSTAQARSPIDSDPEAAHADKPAAPTLQRTSPSPGRSALLTSAEYVFVALVLISQYVWPVFVIWLGLKLIKANRKVSADRSSDDNVADSSEDGDLNDNSRPATSSQGGDYSGGGASDRW